MKRFRWTRTTYKHAHHVARLLNRFLDMPDHMPEPVRLYIKLWDNYRASHPFRDPLEEPLYWRLDRFKGGDEIPF